MKRLLLKGMLRFANNLSPLYKHYRNDQALRGLCKMGPDHAILAVFGLTRGILQEPRYRFELFHIYWNTHKLASILTRYYPLRLILRGALNYTVFRNIPAAPGELEELIVDICAVISDEITAEGARKL
ncbi:hypothetical protein AVEN_25696-1 [Araneus ventricosus]|uniref:Uncharacterized protein n=1 Tax=Araneus ventricosus TaxID=182803 RepID=A0A4Y2KZU0_ARAVE|nr:hypothetical protein AVEN_25696-1 [Araneus ventricosus]